MDDITINHDITIPSAELDLSFSRSGGPGGQHVNKTETRVALTWDLSSTTALRPDVLQRLRKLAHNRLTKADQLIIVSQRTRSQSRNIDDCVERLRELVREALVKPKPRKKKKPPRSVIEKRLKRKRQRSEKKKQRKKQWRKWLD